MSPEIEDIRALYEEAFRWYDAKRKVPEIEVSFYPYVGINHTIRIRDSRIFVRIGDLCREMPLASHKGLAYILTGKLLRKKIPPGAREIYSKFAKATEVREKAADNKRTKGRKVVTTSKGAVYDLDEIFASLNAEYFGRSIPKPALTWSAKKTYRILGHHDATHDHIAISISLDTPETPRYVVEYVVYHEMLHIHHPTKHVNGRRYNHTAAFKRDEQKFAYYEEAERWVERNVRRLKNEAKKR
ncbi:MAG TPA: SprT-like domain-containing protein [Pyrinomonadaceae bacterium]|nr:SprT-like domain-containing protein [Pyrinomonadaceae bacterium]